MAPLPTTSPAYTASNSDRGSERYGDFATLREDVGKKISPSPLEGDVDVVACSQPRLTPGRVLVWAAFDPPRIPAARPNPLMVPTRRFRQAVASTASVLLKGPQLWGKALTILSPRAKCFPYALLESWLQHSMRQEGNQTMNESGHLSLSSGYSLPPIYFLDGQHFLPSPVTQRSGGERSPCAAKRSRGGTTSSFHLLRSGLF